MKLLRILGVMAGINMLLSYSTQCMSIFIVFCANLRSRIHFNFDRSLQLSNYYVVDKDGKSLEEIMIEESEKRLVR